MRWIRLDVAFDDSPWIFMLGPEAKLSWIMLLCHVKAQGVSGRCKALDYRVAAKKWGVSVDAVQSLIDAGLEEGAIAIEDDCWVVTAWAKYQENDATSRERKQRQRGKTVTNRDEVEVTEVTPGHGVTDNVTVCHGVTPVTSGVTCSRDRDRDIDSIPYGTPDGGSAGTPNDERRTTKPGIKPKAKPVEPDTAGDPFDFSPFARATRVLGSVAEAIEGYDAPRRPDVLRHVKPDSAIPVLLKFAESRGLVEHGAEEWVAGLFVHAHQHWNHPPTWPSVMAQRSQLAEQITATTRSDPKPFVIPKEEFEAVA